MTVPSLAWVQTGTDPQRIARMAQGGALGRPTAAFTTAVSPTTGGGSHGVVGVNDFLCSGTTLTIAVAAGGAFINAAAAAGGCWYAYNDASANVVLNAHNTNPRIDLIILRVQDNGEDAGGVTSTTLDKVTGTPAASPTVPAVPTGSLVLAQVAVPANSGATTVTDRRRWAAALGGRLKCRSTERPTGAALQDLMEIVEVDTDSFLWYDLGSTKWRYHYKPFIAYTPSSTSLNAGGNSLGNASWLHFFSVEENRCTVNGELILGSTTNFVAAFTFQVAYPTGFAPRTDIAAIGTGQVQFLQQSTGKHYPGYVQMNSASGFIEVMNNGGPQGQNYQVGAQPFVWAAGDVFRWQVSYPLA